MDGIRAIYDINNTEFVRDALNQVASNKEITYSRFAMEKLVGWGFVRKVNAPSSGPGRARIQYVLTTKGRNRIQNVNKSRMKKTTDGVETVKSNFRQSLEFLSGMMNALNETSEDYKAVAEAHTAISAVIEAIEKTEKKATDKKAA